MEVATLGLKVDGAPVDKARNSLDKFSDSADKAEASAKDLGSGVNKAGKQAQDRLKKVEDRARAVGDRFKLMAAAAAAAIGGIGFGRLVNETAAFEQSLLGLEVVSGATAAQMKQLEEQSRTLGATSMFSAQQAADAQNFLAMAGFNVNETLSATPGILELAAAGSIDLATAADLASNVLGGFRLEAEELTRVNDVLAATAASSNTNINQLGQALSFAAPIAAAAGIEIEETAAAIGVLSDAGLQGSRAGTGLLGVIRQLSNLTPNAKAALADYGLTADQVNIETEGLSTVLERLGNAGISAADAFTIFGSEAGPAAQILASGAVRVNEFTGELELAEGAAKRAALILGSGLTGSMRSFSSAVGESTLQLGRDSGLSFALSGVIDSATGVLSVYNDMLPEFAEANDLTESQADNLKLVAAALATTTTIVGSATAGWAAYRGVVYTVAAAQTVLNRTMAANPIGLLIVAASTAIGVLYSFREELGLVSKAAVDAANNVKQLQAATNDYRNELRGLTSEQLNARRIETVAKLQEETKALRESEAAIAAAKEEYQALSEQTAQGGSFAMFDVDPSVVNGVDEANRAYNEQRQVIGELGAEIGLIDEQQRQLNQTQVDLIEPTNTVATTIAGVGESSDKSSKEVDKLERSMQSLVDRLYPAEAAHRQFREDMELLDLKAAADATFNLADAQARLNTEYSRELTGGFMEQVGTGGFAREIEETRSVADELGLTFTSAFEDAIAGGNDFRDVLSGIAEDITKLLIRKSITEPAADAIGGFDWGSLVTTAIGAFGGGGGGSTGVGGSYAGIFAEGGYTGDGGKYEPKGIVHGGEFVIQKSVVSQPGVLDMLERLNNSGYANGGYVGASPVPSIPSMSGGGGGTTVQVIDQRSSGGAAPEVSEQTGPNGMRRIRILIRDEVKGMFNDGTMDRTMTRNYGPKRRAL